MRTFLDCTSDMHSMTRKSDDRHYFHVSVDFVIIAGNSCASSIAIAAAFGALRDAW